MSVRTTVRSQDIAVRGRARSIEGVPEGIDYADPAAVLMASEDQEEAPAAQDRSDVASLLMGHLFGDGPHPEHVTRRLYRLTAAIEPELIQALPFSERITLMADDEAARDERVVMLLRGTRQRHARAATHQRVIREVLNAAWTRQKHLLMTSEVPSAALLGYGAGDQFDQMETVAQFQARQEAVVALLRFFFHDSPAPEHAMKRVFMVAKAYFEPLVLGMSLHHLAKMFGQVRATWSWRGKKKLSGFLRARGMSGGKAPYQKSDAVCVKYSEAATGNRNRKQGRRVA